MNEIKFVVFKKKETLLQSIISDVFTGLMLSFCVYVSQDSTWWTFVTGLMFLAFMYVVIVKASKKQNRFSSKKELLVWVKSLPEDEE